jgi:hypothetical protein
MNGKSCCNLPPCRSAIHHELFKLMVQDFIDVLKELAILAVRYKMLNTTPVHEDI